VTIIKRVAFAAAAGRNWPRLTSGYRHELLLFVKKARYMYSPHVWVYFKFMPSFVFFAKRSLMHKVSVNDRYCQYIRRVTSVLSYFL